MNDLFGKNFYRTFQIIVLTIFLLPILAPIFANFSITTPFAKVIYLVYSYSCHQLAHRSLHIYDHQCAWCTRDTFIWGGILLATFLVSRFNITHFRVYWLIPFIIPIALDGGIQTIASLFGLTDGSSFYSSTNLTRAITGGIFGIGIGMFLSTVVKNADLNIENIKSSLVRKEVLKASIFGLSILMMFYILFIRVWDISSNEYKPDNFLDWSAKSPEDNTWIRQSNGACEPEIPKDIKSSASPQQIMFTPADCF